MKIINLLLLVSIWAQVAQSLMKTCKPSFNNKLISGSDVIKMRWEYCTKMTFSKRGYAEWHAMSAYENSMQFDKLFMNYLIEN